MAATFNIVADTAGADTAPGTSTVVDALSPANVRFSTADNAEVNLLNPIEIPTVASTVYSRWKSLYLQCLTAPDNAVDTLLFFTDGTVYGSGVDVFIANDTLVKSSTSSTGYQISDLSNEPMTDRGDITGETNISSFTDLAAKTIGISETGNLINAIGETSNYLVLQMQVDETASPGTLSTETLTIQYDET